MCEPHGMRQRRIGAAVRRLGSALIAKQLGQQHAKFRRREGVQDRIDGRVDRHDENHHPDGEFFCSEERRFKFGNIGY